MREWTKTPLGAAASLVIILGMPANTLAQTPRYDLLLKGGHVIDPANHVDAVTDVAVSKDKIAAVEKEIPASQAEKVVDASGLYVTPGLIDIHVHIGHGGAPLDWFTPEGRAHTAPYGIPADLALQAGVTTIVDAGSSGAETFLLEKKRSLIAPKCGCWPF
jgi:dihydroorotase